MSTDTHPLADLQLLAAADVKNHLVDVVNDDDDDDNDNDNDYEFDDEDDKTDLSVSVSPQPFERLCCRILLSLSTLALASSSSVPNSSHGLFSVKRRAKDGRFFSKSTGVRRAQRRAKFNFRPSFAVFSYATARSDNIELPKQLTNALNVH